MLDSLLTCKVFCSLLVDRLIENIALVSSHDDWCILPDLVDEFTVPLRCPLEGVLVCYIVDEESPCSVLVVHLCQGVVLFLPSCVPNYELDALFAHLYCLLEVAGVDSGRLAFVEGSLYELC